MLCETYSALFQLCAILERMKITESYNDNLQYMPLYWFLLVWFLITDYKLAVLTFYADIYISALAVKYLAEREMDERTTTNSVEHFIAKIISL
jgi:hypothetical protein